MAIWNCCIKNKHKYHIKSRFENILLELPCSFKGAVECDCLTSEQWIHLMPRKTDRLIRGPQEEKPWKAAGDKHAGDR